jgi:hypothetical protein
MSNFSNTSNANYALLAIQMLHFNFPQSPIITQQTHVRYEAAAKYYDTKILCGKRTWEKIYFC